MPFLYINAQGSSLFTESNSFDISIVTMRFASSFYICMLSIDSISSYDWPLLYQVCNSGFTTFVIIDSLSVIIIAQILYITSMVAIGL